MDPFSPDNDTITPCEVTVPYKVTPERRLWICVAALAVEDLENGNSDELEQWIQSDTFKFICKALGARPGEAARYLRLTYG